MKTAIRGILTERLEWDCRVTAWIGNTNVMPWMLVTLLLWTNFHATSSVYLFFTATSHSSGLSMHFPCTLWFKQCWMSVQTSLAFAWLWMHNCTSISCCCTTARCHCCINKRLSLASTAASAKHSVCGELLQSIDWFQAFQKEQSVQWHLCWNKRHTSGLDLPRMNWLYSSNTFTFLFCFPLPINANLLERRLCWGR